MLVTHAAVDTFAPQIKTAPLQLPAHEGDYIRFTQPKLKLDGLKRGAVFPRHFNDAVGLGRIGGHGGWLLTKEQLKRVDCFVCDLGDQPGIF